MATTLVACAVALAALAGCAPMNQALRHLLQETPTASVAPVDTATPTAEPPTATSAPPDAGSTPYDTPTPCEPTPTTTPTMGPSETPTISLLMGPARELLARYPRPLRTPPIAVETTPLAGEGTGSIPTRTSPSELVPTWTPATPQYAGTLEGTLAPTDTPCFDAGTPTPSATP